MVVFAFALKLFSYCLVIYCGGTVRCFWLDVVLLFSCNDLFVYLSAVVCLAWLVYGD